MADAVEPIHSLLEMGMASLDEFHVTSFQLSQQGEHRAVWEARLGETNTTGSPIRWQTNRIWKAGHGGAHSQNVMTPAKDRGVSRTFGNGNPWQKSFFLNTFSDVTRSSRSSHKGLAITRDVAIGIIHGQCA